MQIQHRILKSLPLFQFLPSTSNIWKVCKTRKLLSVVLPCYAMTWLNFWTMPQIDASWTCVWVSIYVYVYIFCLFKGFRNFSNRLYFWRLPAGFGRRTTPTPIKYLSLRICKTCKKSWVSKLSIHNNILLYIFLTLIICF